MKILKNAVIIMTSVIKDDGRFYPQLFFEKALNDEKVNANHLKRID